MKQIFSGKLFPEITIALILFLALSVTFNLKHKAERLEAELQKTEQERLRYANIIKMQGIPTPTPLSKYDFVMKRFAKKVDATEPKYLLECNDVDSGEELKFSSSLELNGTSQPVAECFNQELSQVLVLVETFLEDKSSIENPKSAKILLFDYTTQKTIELFNSEQSITECENEFEWFKKGWIYFSCERIPTGEKGDFYPGPKIEYGYYKGRDEERFHDTYIIEQCHQPSGFESTIKTQQSCIALCNQDSDCQINHFCDLSQKEEYKEEYGVCVKSCASSLQCSPEVCSAYEYKTSVRPKELDEPYQVGGAYTASRLGCEYF